MESRTGDLGRHGRAGNPLIASHRSRSRHFDGGHDITPHLSHPAQVSSEPVYGPRRLRVPGGCVDQARSISIPARDSGTPGTAPDKLNFSYSVERERALEADAGLFGWRENLHSILEISIEPDAPVLFVVSGGQNRIVNYRMQRNMMIVDYAVDKAILVSGVGWRQQKLPFGGRLNHAQASHHHDPPPPCFQAARRAEDGLTTSSTRSPSPAQPQAPSPATWRAGLPSRSVQPPRQRSNGKGLVRLCFAALEAALKGWATRS